MRGGPGQRSFILFLISPASWSLVLTGTPGGVGAGAGASVVGGVTAQSLPWGGVAPGLRATQGGLKGGHTWVTELLS